MCDMAEPLGQRLARRLPVLDAVADALQPRLRAALGARLPLRDALDGTWLGAPLHPALTDVPVGAMTTAALLDAAESMSGSRDLAVAADRALAAAVVGTLPAALTGASDWRDLRGETRRIATLHALLNVTGLVLNLGSLVLRAQGRRSPAKATSALAFLTSSVAAHIGGELSFGFGVRVNRTAWQRTPSDFVPVLDENEIEGDALRRVEVDGTPVVVARSRAGDLCAIAATCTHLGGPLDEGARDGDTVVCPWHASRFDLCTGEVLGGPAVFPEPRFEVRLRDGKIELRHSRP
jgi:nitrite reductase/ring-hydroxylating ferredoxin subunit/uncharacterized membrane protein